MVVRFVCVIRVPVCARVSRVCPGSPRAPGVSFYRYCTVPVLSRLPPVSFYRYCTVPNRGSYRYFVARAGGDLR